MKRLPSRSWIDSNPHHQRCSSSGVCVREQACSWDLDCPSKLTFIIIIIASTSLKSSLPKREPSVVMSGQFWTLAMFPSSVDKLRKEYFDSQSCKAKQSKDKLRKEYFTHRVAKLESAQNAPSAQTARDQGWLFNFDPNVYPELGNVKSFTQSKNPWTKSYPKKSA